MITTLRYQKYAFFKLNVLVCLKHLKNTQINILPYHIEFKYLKIFIHIDNYLFLRVTFDSNKKVYYLSVSKHEIILQ